MQLFSAIVNIVRNKEGVLKGFMQKDPLDHEKKKMLKALEFLFIMKGCGVFYSSSSYQGIYIYSMESLLIFQQTNKNKEKIFIL